MPDTLTYRDATLHHPGAWLIGRTEPDGARYVFSQAPGAMHPSIYEEGSGWRGQLDTADNVYIINRRCREAGYREENAR